MRSVGTKLFLFIGTVMFISSFFLLYRAYSLSDRYVRELVSQQADMALKFDMAIRKYVAEKIRPVMYELMGQEEFVPEIMSTSYVARAIFEDIHKEFPDFILKFSSDNPRNPANQAGPEERKIIEYFNNNPQVKMWAGEMTVDGKHYMARFNARRMKESCLRCHGDTADAPASLLKRYGATAGFYRPVGEVIALDTVAIPMSRVDERLWAEATNNFMAIGAGFVLLIGTMFLATRFLVTNRLAAIAKHFTSAANQTEYSQIEPIEEKGNDEIGALARSFNTLANKLHGYYTSLEAQIKERTKTNDQLKLEMEERWKAVKALRESESSYRALAENLPGLVYRLFIKENKRMQFLNDMLEPITGYQPQELENGEICSIEPLIMPEYRSKIRHAVKHAIMEAEPFEVEYRLRHRDGKIRWLFERGRPVYEMDGELLYIDGVIFDITKRKTAEIEKQEVQAQLYQAQKMESIGRLSGGIAHDFNNILTTILGYCEIIQMKLPEDHPLRENIDTIYDAGQRAAVLTRQLLAFSRKQVMEMQVVNPNGIIDNIAKMMRPLMGDDVELEIHTQPSVGNIMADSGQIEQIIMNLAVNAKDAMPCGGCLIIETGAIDVDEEYARNHEGLKTGQYVMLTVTDTGEGMTQEMREQIFEPFFTTKEKGKGTGLGLATAYGIVKQHNGHIFVYSEPGKGTTFKIYFPAVSGVAEELAVETREFMPRGMETILVVDDEPSIRKLIFDTLRPLGYRVIEATCGKDAMAISKETEGNIDLLLTDVVMPGMNGQELTDLLKPTRPDMKVVFMSGYTDNVIADQGVLQPGTEFINKPLVPSMLALKLREILEGKQ